MPVAMPAAMPVAMPPTEFDDNGPLPLSSIKLLGLGAGVGE